MKLYFYKNNLNILMINWMLNIYSLILLLSHILLYMKCQNNIKYDFKQRKENYFNYKLEPGKVILKYLNDSKDNHINFAEEIKDDLLVNLYSPSCDIYLENNIAQKELIFESGNAFSIEFKNKSFKNAIINPVPKPYLINDNPKYQEKRICPLVINTIEVNKLILSVEEKEPTFLYFYENLTQIILSYNFAKLKKNSSLTLSFSFNNVTKFNINISNIKYSNISNSTSIFLDSDFLSKIKEKKLNIKINLIENKNCSLIFQIIEPNSI